MDCSLSRNQCCHFGRILRFFSRFFVYLVEISLLLYLLGISVVSMLLAILIRIRYISRVSVPFKKGIQSSV